MDNLITPTPDASDEVTEGDRSYSMWLHLSALLAPLLLPLLLWAVKKDDSKFVNASGKMALNLSLSSMIYLALNFVALLVLMILRSVLVNAGVGSGAMTWVATLIPLAVVVALAIWLPVCAIVLAIKANRGELYTPPLVIQILK